MKTTYNIALNVFCALCLFPAYFSPVMASEEDLIKDSACTLYVTDTNLDTNVTTEQTIPLDETSTKVYEIKEDGEVILASSFSVYLSIEEGSVISPQDSGGGTKTEAGVTANMTLYYTPVRADGTFKVTGFSGNWVSSASYNLISNRSCGCKDIIGGNSVQYYPTSNSYSYSTGWGWQTRIWDYTNGPAGWSSCTITPSGMGSASHILDLYFTV